MDAGDLQQGFRLSEWLVEPRDGRITGRGLTLTLPPEQLRILLRLAASHGEAVDRRTLCEAAWPDRHATDHMLRHSIGELRAAFGESSHDTRIIVPVARGGYALIAHFEPLPASSVVPAPASGEPVVRSVPSRVLGFVAELRRRSVLKVVGAYLVGMWIVLQVAQTTFAPLRFPDWWMTVLTILTVLGLPIVAVLAWSYEITPGGVVLDEGSTTAVRLPRARRAVAPIAVAGVSLMALVTGFAWWRSLESSAGATRAALEASPASVAVLPLVDMSRGGGNSYLGDGLSEELSLRLAQVPGLRVAARTSAFEFKGRNLDVRKIGESLGVRHVLEGSVRRDGDSLRVTVQLIDAANGYHVWAGSYDREWRDLLSIQDDVARSIAAALSVVLTPEAERELAVRSNVDARAFDPYLAGLALLQQSGDLSRLREAGQRFGEALAIDPGFARAHAGLCDVGVRVHERSRDPADLVAAERSCREALALDASLVETGKGLAALYLAGGKHDEAARVYRSLIERNPRDADGHVGLGRALQGLARLDVAEQSFRRAVAEEPAYWRAFAALGTYLYDRGRIDEAIEAYRKVTELTPASAVAYNNLGAALQMKGDLAASAAAYRRSLAIEPSRGAYSNLGTYHYYLGQFAEAAAQYGRAAALAPQDQILWGNLADALWQLPQRRPEALGYYRRAIGLAEREVAAGNDDALVLAQLAYYCERIGDTSRAGTYLARAMDLGGDSPYVAYYAAVAMTARGDTEEAARLVKLAVANGYPQSLLETDPLLRSRPGDGRVAGAALGASTNDDEGGKP